MAKYLNRQNCYNSHTMKNQTAISSLLGLTQHETAMLLGVSRSLLSLYELGKRDLPLRATLLLAEILQHVNTPQAKPVAFRANPEHLGQLLRENEFQRLRLERKMAKAARKLLAQQRRLRLAEFLDAPQHAKTTQVSGPAFQLRIKKSHVDWSATVVEYQHKKELLAIEQAMLESQLQLRKQPTR